MLLGGWSALGFFVIRCALLDSVESDVRAFQMAYAIGTAGYFLLVWQVLRGGTATSIRWQWWVLGCLCLRLIPIAMQPTDDAHRYLWEGAIQRAGHNPYQFAPNDPQLTHLRDDDWARINHPDYPAIYGPVALLQFRLVSAVYPSIYAVKLLHVVWDALTIIIIAACLGTMGKPPHFAIVYALSPLVLTSFAIEGHMDSLMILAISLAVWLELKGRLVLAGIAIGLAISVKVVAVVFLPWLLWRCRKGLAAAILTVFVCYLPFASAGPDLFESLMRFAGGDPFFSLAALAQLHGIEPPIARWVCAAGLLLALPILALRWKSLPSYALKAAEALVLLMSVLHYWYLSLVLMLIPMHFGRSGSHAGFPIRWLVMSAAMLVYFEAEFTRATTGQWAMPEWATRAVWITLGIAWSFDVFKARRSHRRRPTTESPPVENNKSCT